MIDDDMKIDSPIEEAKDRLTALEKRMFEAEVSLAKVDAYAKWLEQILSIHMQAGYHG